MVYILKVKYDVSFEIINDDTTIPHTVRTSGGINVPDDVSLTTLNESILDYILTHLDSDPKAPVMETVIKPIPDTSKSYAVSEMLTYGWGPCIHCRTNNACKACEFNGWVLNTHWRFHWNGNKATHRIVQHRAVNPGQSHYDFTIEPGEAIHNQATWEVNKNVI